MFTANGVNTPKNPVKKIVKATNKVKTTNKLTKKAKKK